jgi:hypothetical protein
LPVPHPLHAETSGPSELPECIGHFKHSKLSIFSENSFQIFGISNCQNVRREGVGGDILAEGADCHGWVCGNTYLEYFVSKINVFDISNI